MEFQYRAGDERLSRSPPPRTPAPSAAPSTSGSAEGHCGGDAAERVENPAVLPGKTPAVAEASDADELRRQAAKERIRERILRESAEHWALEIEVRRELSEQLFRQPWPLLSPSAWGSDPPVAPAPALKAQPKAKAPAASPAKRKSPDNAAASSVSVATSSKQQKLGLTCTVCGITSNSEKAMQDHRKGKAHRKKVAALATQPAPEPEHDAEDDEDVMVPVAPSSDYTPTKLTMLTNAGTLNEVTQMDGYLLCELCNVRTADRVTMMCHLEGSKHISKARKKRPATSELPAEAATTAKRRVKAHSAAATAFAVSGNGPNTVVLEVDGVPHTMRRVEGFLLCVCCDVKAPSESVMRSHLSGKKHKNKANGSSAFSVNVSAGGKDKDTAVVADTVAQVEAPSAEPLPAKVCDRSEMQEIKATLAKEDVATVDGSKTPGKEVMMDGSTTTTADAPGDTDLVVMEVHGLQHRIRRVDGFLFCACCNMKAPSEIIMRSHLGGKKHKRKMTPAASTVDASAQGNKKDASVVATGVDQVQGNGFKTVKADDQVVTTPSEMPQEKKAAMVVPNEVDEPAGIKSIAPNETAENGEITQEAEGDHAAAAVNVSVKESADTAAPGKPVKVLVEGVVFTVLRQENGRLSCQVCCVHGCDKDDMILHLYTRTHWEKARLGEEKEQAGATEAVVDKDGDSGSLVVEGTAQVEN